MSVARIRRSKARRTPTVDELPAPPAGRVGWPWTVATPPTAERRPDGQRWPVISVVTASFRQGEFLEETIRSVLLQGYHALEYLVLDAGSDDETADILERYQPWLSFCRSEPDNGQVAALNEGFRRATGHWRGWLNADDFYAPGALQHIGRVAVGTSWVVGRTAYVDARGHPIGEFPRQYRAASVAEEPWIDVLCARASGTALPQQSTFWTAAAQKTVGFLDESFPYTFEHEYWIRLARVGYEPLLVDAELCSYRRHPKQKTVHSTRAKAFAEEARAIDRWLAASPRQHRPLLRRYRRECVVNSWRWQFRTRAARTATAIGALRLHTGPRSHEKDAANGPTQSESGL